MDYTYELINSNLYFSENVIDFFTAKVRNIDEYNSIIEHCLSTVNNENDPQANSLIKIGYLSRGDMTSYFSKKGIIKGSYSSQLIDIIIKGLVHHYIIEPIADYKHIENWSKRFIILEERAKIICDHGLVLNLLCGWQYIIDKYSSSVFKFVRKEFNGDCSIGSGFYHEFNYDGFTRGVIITNEHVLNGFECLNIYDSSDEEIPFKSLHLDNQKDLGFVLLDKPMNRNPLILNPSAKILSEVITIGYPSVPRAKDAYQLVHKGEINAFVKDYRYNNDFVLFSAKTSSGNSGSPLVDSWGLVVGIVSDEFYEKTELIEKGKLPYYAAIPTTDIVESLKRLFKLS